MESSRSSADGFWLCRTCGIYIVLHDNTVIKVETTIMFVQVVCLHGRRDGGSLWWLCRLQPSLGRSCLTELGNSKWDVGFIGRWTFLRSIY